MRIEWNSDDDTYVVRTDERIYATGFPTAFEAAVWLENDMDWRSL